MRFDAVPYIYAVGAVPAAFFFVLKFSWRTFDKTNKKECRSKQGEDPI